MPDMGWPAPLDCRCTVPGRPAAVLHKAEDFPHSTEAESEYPTLAF